MYVVYKATNTINNKIYVGATKDLKRRIREHKSHSKHGGNKFYDAICMYGFENFTFEVLYESDNKEDIFEKEIYYINKLNSLNDEVGYNQANGGIGGKTHDVSGNKNPMCGRQLTEEQKQQISEKLKGRKDSEETRLKKSIAMKGKKKTKEQILKRSKPISVINIHTGEILNFISRAEMERTIHTNTNVIINGGTTKSGYRLYIEQSQETIESIAKEKDFSE